MSESCSNTHGYFEGRKTASREATYHDPISGKDLFVVFGAVHPKDDEINANSLVKGAEVVVSKWGFDLSLKYEPEKLKGHRGRAGFDVKAMVALKGPKAGEVYLQGALEGMEKAAKESAEYARKVFRSVAEFGSGEQIAEMAAKLSKWGWDDEMLGGELRDDLRHFFAESLREGATRVSGLESVAVAESVGAELYLFGKGAIDSIRELDRVAWAEKVTRTEEMLKTAAKFATVGAFGAITELRGAMATAGMRERLFGWMSSDTTENGILEKAGICYRVLLNDAWVAGEEELSGSRDIEVLEDRLIADSLSLRDRYDVLARMKGMLDERSGVWLSKGRALSARAGIDRALEIYPELKRLLGA